MTGTDYSALCKQSPDKAYQTLFDEYCNYVYAVVYSKLRDCATREDIEECVSDIFAEIYTKYDIDSGFEGDMRGYIGTVAKRRAVNSYHQLSAHGITVSLDEEDAPEPADDHDPEEERRESELSRLLLEKILSLGEPDSSIIIQKYYYDRSSAEIAGQLNMNPSTVRVRCRRAVAKLKKIIDKPTTEQL